jgi:AraC family transcriptional regulator of adaptative response / DNA-3-methyladenine glycosylase II
MARGQPFNDVSSFAMNGLPHLSREVLHRARLSRDPRFDGKFFVAAMTTRIYCRPICPARSSRESNVQYFATATEAAEAGFRPCLRCRPEAAPGSSAWVGTCAVVRRALRLIQEGALDDESLDDLADRLGISGRHLARLFAQHVGASPAAVAQTRRLHFAKQLLDDTPLSITNIALASGFRSVRRFNDAFLAAYRRSPTELRKRRPANSALGGTAEITLRLAYRPPYDWTHLHEYLAEQAIGGVEKLSEGEYARAIRTIRSYALIRIRPMQASNALELKVSGAELCDLTPLLSSVRRMFDLTADPAAIGLILKNDPLLRPLIQCHPGLRIPGVWEPFECTVRAILRKQLDSAATRAVLGVLVQRLGRPIEVTQHGITHLFPQPHEIAAADFDALGLPRSAQDLLALAALAPTKGTLGVRASEVAGTTLGGMPGLGRWISGYVALHGLGAPDAFLYGDRILRRQASSRGFPLSAEELTARATRWRPFRGYAVLHLWKAHAEGCA